MKRCDDDGFNQSFNQSVNQSINQSISFYLYSANSQLKLSNDTIQWEQV